MKEITKSVLINPKLIVLANRVLVPGKMKMKIK